MHVRCFALDYSPRAVRGSGAGGKTMGACRCESTSAYLDISQAPIYTHLGTLSIMIGAGRLTRRRRRGDSA